MRSSTSAWLITPLAGIPPGPAVNELKPLLTLAIMVKKQPAPERRPGRVCSRMLVDLLAGRGPLRPPLHRRGRLWLDRIAEQTVEERRPARIALAIPIPVRKPDRGPAVARLRPRDRDFGLAMVALQHRKEAGVAPINVLACLQVALLVHESGLIGDVHRDRRREAQVDLGVTVHALDLVRRVAAPRHSEAGH